MEEASAHEELTAAERRKADVQAVGGESVRQRLDNLRPTYGDQSIRIGVARSMVVEYKARPGGCRYPSADTATCNEARPHRRLSRSTSNPPVDGANRRARSHR